MVRVCVLFLFGSPNVKGKKINHLVKLTDPPIVARSRRERSNGGTGGYNSRSSTEDLLVVVDEVVNNFRHKY